MPAPQTLPEVNVPIIFDMVGGTRVFLVRSGPGNRSKKECGNGKCDLSMVPDFGRHSATDDVQAAATLALEPLLTTLNKFDQNVRIVARPHVFHDGSSKSRDAYDIFMERKRVAFYDGMKDAPEQVDAAYFWSKLNRKDAGILNTFVVFASTETIYKVMNSAGCTARLLCAAGAIVPTVFPVVGKPSVGIGLGPNANGCMRWGNVTEEEFVSASQPPASKRTATAEE